MILTLAWTYQRVSQNYFLKIGTVPKNHKFMMILYLMENFFLNALKKDEPEKLFFQQKNLVPSKTGFIDTFWNISSDLKST